VCLPYTILLNDPDELLTTVIENQRNVNGGDVTGYGMRGGELKLINQILMVRSDKAFTFFRIQIDIVPEELESGWTNRVNNGCTMVAIT
jgi:hypothetical protein